jgi:hypothetical protein
MTGPEHYRRAEILIEDMDQGGGLLPNRIALAQIHATLAFAAAAALMGRPTVPHQELNAWSKVASVARL